MAWLGALIAWRWWQSSSRQGQLGVPAAPMDDGDREASDLALAEIALTRASAVLEIELGTADVIDLKSVGLATADLAALTILVAFHEAIDYWWAPAFLMALSAVFFFLVLRSREWDWAPDFDEFRAEQAGRSRTQISDAMLAVVLLCRETNYKHLTDKSKFFRLGYSTLAVGLLALVGVALSMVPW